MVEDASLFSFAFLQLALMNGVVVLKPSKISFRCNPSVLIVAIMWHEMVELFTDTLYSNLVWRYAGNGGSVSATYCHTRRKVLIRIQVMLLKGTLDSQSHPALAEQSVRDAARFLKEYPTAKIVIIIDTQCLENGLYVWRRDTTKGEFEACQMEEVSSI